MRRGKAQHFRDPCELCWKESAEGSIGGVAIGPKCRAITIAIKRDADRDQLARRREVLTSVHPAHQVP